MSILTLYILSFKEYLKEITASIETLKELTQLYTHVGDRPITSILLYPTYFANKL